MTKKKKLKLKKKSHLEKFLYQFYIKTSILLTMIKILMLFYGIAGTQLFALSVGKLSWNSLPEVSEKWYKNLLTAGVAEWRLVKLYLVDEERQTKQWFLRFLFSRPIKIRILFTSLCFL